ncbi:hypothetical protein [Kibdelosporangium phytohabitans]|uniref:Replicative helicase inhibitor G39P N-terminal domain-containing protein n=1 Tax=Kibdelosporangium phytohabitans TaxID=860235 RepID=A0A0N9HQ78_9PSEU|nr:hypothetical protein [Kibdelosporangium phytohabitans]ALG06835.1 hypothetical protein AOZ06_07740 [Kibdelosporangium phytohabitans]MBE1468081.1 hypothetical protein [Kibdelosporangium phytohabitans]
MTEDEIRALLAVAMSYDNRRPGDANVAAWQESAARAKWTFPEAVNAIKDYYTNTTDPRPFVMPSHVTAALRQGRRQPAPYTAIESASPASEEHKQRMKALIGDHFAMPRDLRKPLTRQEPA